MDEPRGPIQYKSPQVHKDRDIHEGAMLVVGLPTEVKTVLDLETSGDSIVAKLAFPYGERSRYNTEDLSLGLTSEIERRTASSDGMVSAWDGNLLAALARSALGDSENMRVKYPFETFTVKHIHGHSHALRCRKSRS